VVVFVTFDKDAQVPSYDPRASASTDRFADEESSSTRCAPATRRRGAVAEWADNPLSRWGLTTREETTPSAENQAGARTVVHDMTLDADRPALRAASSTPDSSHPAQPPAGNCERGGKQSGTRRLRTWPEPLVDVLMVAAQTVVARSRRTYHRSCRTVLALGTLLGFPTLGSTAASTLVRDSEVDGFLLRIRRGATCSCWEVLIDVALRSGERETATAEPSWRSPGSQGRCADRWSRRSSRAVDSTHRAEDVSTASEMGTAKALPPVQPCFRGRCHPLNKKAGGQGRVP